jgi:hypothetical protein
LSDLRRRNQPRGSSLGTAVAGTILVAGLDKGSYAAAMIVLAAIGLIGLGATMRVPAHARQTSS